MDKVVKVDWHLKELRCSERVTKLNPFYNLNWKFYMEHDVKPIIIILAAGKSKRMNSHFSKVMHEIGGMPIIGHVIQSALKLDPAEIILVLGPDSYDIQEYTKALSSKIKVYIQHERLGTAHAVLTAKHSILAHKDRPILVLLGDTPFVSPKVIQENIYTIQQGSALSVTGFKTKNPFGYGRMIMQGDQLIKIVEQKDANQQENEINFCNSGLMVFAGENCLEILEEIKSENAQQEFYITDAVSICNKHNLKVRAVEANQQEFIGINDRIQLAEAEQIFQHYKRREMLASGVTMIAPDTVYFSYDTIIGKDCVIEPSVVFKNAVKIANNTIVYAYSYLENCEIGENVKIGPFARIRPGSFIEKNSKIGNFVETKNAIISEGAKVNHLSYIGDAHIGKGANIGAGTITCNYDGINKHKTIIGDAAFIGSNTSLVAPVTIEEGAYIGSGSVITENVPANSLSLTRATQTTIENWAKKFREKFSKKRITQ